MEIVIKNLPSVIHWTSGFMLDLIGSVQHVAKGITPKILQECSDRDGATVYAIVPELPFEMSFEGQQVLAASILQFLLWHGFYREPYVVIKDKEKETVYKVSDFPRLVERYFPSRK